MDTDRGTYPQSDTVYPNRAEENFSNLALLTRAEQSSFCHHAIAQSFLRNNRGGDDDR
jgi:hypothetical protein